MTTKQLNISPGRKPFVGERVWYACNVSGEGPTIWEVEVAETLSWCSKGKIISKNGVAPEPYPDDIRKEYPDCDIRTFDSQHYWSKQEAMKALTQEMHEIIGRYESLKAKVSYEWQIFLSKQTP